LSSIFFVSTIVIFIVNTLLILCAAIGVTSRRLRMPFLGAKSLSDDEISNNYDDFVKVMSFGFGKLLEASDKPIDWFKDAFPKP
jgi:hypothetical protein